MTKKIRITLKIILGIFIFYCVLGFIILPLALSWAIKSQGSKFLKTPVNVRSVQFNPFLLQLTVQGFEIQGADQKLIAGFDKLAVDISFLSLLKKVYHIESLELDGFKLNPVLLPDGKVNVQSLIPVDSKPAKSSSAATSAKPQPLPTVIVDKLTVRDGRVNFMDQSIKPNFSTNISGISIDVTGLSTQTESQMNANFKAKIDTKGTIAIDTIAKPFAQPLDMETKITLNGYALNSLTPYVGKYTGHALKDGNLNFKFIYRIANNRLTATHKVSVQKFEFGQTVESKDALPLPFGLAVALLEDPQGRINISLPVNGNVGDPKFHYLHLVGQVGRNFILKLVTKPFSFLASVIGSDTGTDELGSVHFLPGRSDLSDAEKSKLKTLLRGLTERPRLLLEINGSYDPDMDWKAIKTDVFNQDFKKLRHDSTRSDAWVYEELYQRHFGLRHLWALTKKYKTKQGGYDDADLNREIQRQIIEDAPADQTVMSKLGQDRAQAVYTFLTGAGFESRRLSIGQLKTTQGSMGQVPLEFTLTIFDKK